MSGDEATLENMIQRVLHTGERLRGIVILVVNMQVVVFHCLTTLVGEQIVVNERLRGFRSKLHHHTCRCIGIHIGILTCHIIILDVHDIEEHLTRLGLSGHRALVAIGNILLSHILAARLHQFHLDGILNLLYRHLALTTLSDMVGNLIQESLVLTLVGMNHGLTDGSHNLLLVEAHNASVTLYYCLNHDL